MQSTIEIIIIIMFLFFFFCFLHKICGISLFGVGCELLNKMNLIPEYVIKLHILQFELPSVVVAVGIITTIFPLVGCIGALRESKCFLISVIIIRQVALPKTICRLFVFTKKKCISFSLFSSSFKSGTLLILTIIIQTALFCYLLCWSGEDIEHVLNIAWTKNTNDFKYPMDGYQFLVSEHFRKSPLVTIKPSSIQFACCGLKSYEDYLKNSKKIPSTCCGYLAGECEEEVYKERPGCRQTVVEYWELCINAIEFIAIIAATLEIMTLTITCYLFKKTSKLF